MESWLPTQFENFARNAVCCTDLFLSIAANFFLMISILMAKASPELVHCICGMLRSQLNAEE
jgi:hypothetical protein